ncbi:MAG TPA: site-specific integrase [Blastocatellia bacterium]|nr:site-specific integrase [Blastocatellia bacterium]
MAVYKREWEDKEGKKRFSWYFHKTIDGVRYRERIPTARTRAQAEEAERKRLAEIHAGTYGKPKGTVTFKEFAEETYLPWAKTNKKSWKIDSYRLGALIAAFGKKQLRQISPFDVESYKINRLKTPIKSRSKKNSDKEKKRSPAAVNREILLLSRVLRLAITKRELSENPCAEVELLQGERSRERYMLPEEEERLMAVLSGPREHLKYMVILAVQTGLREMELLTLQPEQVDFHRDLLLIFETKTNEPRKVPLNPTARAVLSELVEQAREKGRPYLFTNPDTGSYYTTIKTAWKTACRLAGISNLRFHDLRHTFGTRAADRGEPLNAIQRVMGHKRIETTLQYAHATDDAARRVVAAAERPGHIAVTKEGRRVRLRVVNNRN